MTSARVRTTLFLLAFCVLAGVIALQLVRSVPHAVMFYLVGISLLFVTLSPFVGLIVYLAFFYVKPWLLIPGFADAPVGLVIGGATFVSMLIHRENRDRESSIAQTPQNYLLMWFFLAILVSHLAHGRVDDALGSGYDFLQTIVRYVLIVYTVTSVRRLRIAMHCLGVLTLWVAVQALIIHYTGRGMAGVEEMGDDRVRALTFFGDPNHLAAGLLLLLPFFFLETIRAGNFGRRFYSLIGLVLVCYVVFMTQSRGGAVTLAVVGTLLLARTIGPVKGVLLGGALAAAIYFLGPSRVRELNAAEPSTFGRLLSWKRAFAEFQSSPIFGIGSGQSGHRTGDLVPHNAFMQAAAELGILGLVPWVALSFVSMKNAVFVRKAAKVAEFGSLGLISEALFFSCLAWNVALLFVGSPYYDELFIVLGLCVAAVNIFSQGDGGRYHLMERRDIGYAILLAVMGLVFHRLVLYITGV